MAKNHESFSVAYEHHREPFSPMSARVYRKERKAPFEVKKLIIPSLKDTLTEESRLHSANSALPSDLFTYFEQKDAKAVSAKLPQDTNQERTMKILKEKMRRNRRMDRSLMSAKQGIFDRVIKHNDSEYAVNAVVNLNKNDDEHLHKSLVKGSFFLNDLWGHRYEKSIMRSINIDPESISKRIRSRGKSSESKLPLQPKLPQKPVKQKEKSPSTGRGSVLRRFAAKLTAEDFSPNLASAQGRNIISRENSQNHEDSFSQADRYYVTSPGTMHSRRRLISHPKGYDFEVTPRGGFETQRNESTTSSNNININIHSEESEPISSSYSAQRMKDASCTSKSIKNETTIRPWTQDTQRQSGKDLNTKIRMIRRSRMSESISTPILNKINEMSLNSKSKEAAIVKPEVVVSKKQEFLDRSNQQFDELIGYCDEELKEKGSYNKIFQDLDGLVNFKWKKKKRMEAHQQAKLTEFCQFLVSQRIKRKFTK